MFFFVALPADGNTTLINFHLRSGAYLGRRICTSAVGQQDQSYYDYRGSPHARAACCERVLITKFHSGRGVPAILVAGMGFSMLSPPFVRPFEHSAFDRRGPLCGRRLLRFSAMLLLFLREHAKHMFYALLGECSDCVCLCYVSIKTNALPATIIV